LDDVLRLDKILSTDGGVLIIDQICLVIPDPCRFPDGQTSPVTPNIVSRLHRTLKTFGDLHKPSWIFRCPLLPLDAFRHLSPPSGCLMDLAPQWGPEKMDKEIDLDGEDLPPSHFCIRSA
jgi:hypothetical protein